MIRVVLWNIFLFILPYLVIWAWLLFVKKSNPSDATLRLWAYAAVIGGLFVLMSLLMFRAGSIYDPEKRYISPIVKDGVIIRGHFESVGDENAH